MSMIDDRQLTRTIIAKRVAHKQKHPHQAAARAALKRARKQLVETAQRAGIDNLWCIQPVDEQGFALANEEEHVEKGGAVTFWLWHLVKEADGDSLFDRFMNDIERSGKESISDVIAVRTVWIDLATAQRHGEGES